MFKTITTPAYHIGGGYYPQERKVPCDYDPGQIGKLKTIKIRLIN
jgi:hypothetical protein